MSKHRITFSEITENNIATRLENTLKHLEPHLKIKKQLDAMVPSSIREIAEQQKRWSELSGASLFAQIPSIEKSIPFIDWSKFNQTTSTFENIFKVKRELERHLTPEEREQLKQEAKAAQERLRAMANEPEKVKEVLQEVENNTEIMQAVLCGDEEKLNQLADEERKKALANIYLYFYPYIAFLLAVLNIGGYSLKDYLEPSKEVLYFRKFGIKNAKNAEARKVCFPKGTLNVHKYDRLSSIILTVLPNGSQIALPYKPKGNAEWIKIHAFNDNGDVVVGYVQARFTERFYFE